MKTSSSSRNRKQSNPAQKIMNVTSAFQEAALLMAACQHDLFTVLLRAHSATAEELTGTLHTDLRATGTLLDALCSLGYLKKKSDRYEVAAEFATVLDSRSADTLVPIICHKGTCFRHWGMLDKTIKTGHPQNTPATVRGKAGDHESFILGMNSVARRVIPELINQLEEAGLLQFKNMLDLGGATGTYLEAFLEKNLKGKGTIFDLPATIEQAKRRLTGSPFEKKIALCSGDFYQDEFPDGFDLVWISAIIHQQDNEATKQMFQKAYRALKKKGKIAIRDVFYNDDRTGPPEAGLFSINMLSVTPKGKVYTTKEVFDFLLAAGFKNPHQVIQSNNMSSVIVAEK